MAILSLMWSAALLLLLFVVSHVRLQCDNGVTFRANCGMALRRINFLLNESLLMERIQCRFIDSGNSYRWTRLPDGSQNGVDLDASSNKYVINGRDLTITLSSVTGEDGGLYRCVYSDNTVSAELCIEVHERAVFESCPSEFTSCSGSTQLSVTPGESAVFDASVTYTPGGSCDFQQQLTRVMLEKINNEFGVSDFLMFSCGTDEGAMCTMNDHRVSWSRGIKPGLQFRFTLNNTQLSDNSSYRVTVLGTHPQTGAETSLTKVFNLQVNSAPTSDPTTAPTSPPRTTTINNPVEISGGDNRAVVAGVLVPLLVVILVVTVLGLLFLVVRWKQGSLPSSLYLYKSSGVQKEVVMTNSDAVDSPKRAESVNYRIVSRTEVQPLGNVPNILIEDSVVVSLPPENSRMSFVDSNMHELPSKLQDHEPLNLPLFDRSISDKTLESPGVPV